MRPNYGVLTWGLSCLALVCALSGCVVTQEVYLEDATITAPIMQPPVFFPPDTGESVQLVGHISFAKGTTLDGRVTENAYSPPGAKNLHWTIPDMTGGLAADLRIGKHTSITLGIDFSEGGNNVMVGGVGGLAFHNMGEHAGTWFGFGVMVHPLHYDSRLLVVTTTSGFGSTSVDSAYFHDKGESSPLDFYMAFTVKSRFHDFPLNVFANLLLTRQTLVSNNVAQYDEAHPPVVMNVDAVAAYRTLVFTATPGVSVAVLDNTELVGGVRFFISEGIEGLFDNIVPAPFIQIQMHL